jgi:very-short-patch-repair endonuclease
MAPISPGESPWALADAQYGVVTHEQLHDLGYGDEAIKHRIRRGRLHRIYRGVYVVGRKELSQEGKWMAAVLACGDDAALSHDSAAGLWRMTREPAAPIHVSVLGDRRSRGDIEVHPRPELHMTTHKGIRVTTPAQTLIDLARTWSQSDVEQAIGEAEFRRLISLRALRAAAAKAGNRGAALRRIIDRVTFRVTQSELEREFLRLLERAKLPVPETQRRFGKYRVDFYWPELRLVVEADGGNFHRTTAQQAADRRRDQEHIRAGRTPMRITHGQVFFEADALVDLLVDVFQRLNSAVCG